MQHIAAELCRRLCGLSALQRGVVVTQTAVEALMARFKLELAQTVIERATVWLEANNPQEAEDLMKSMRQNGKLTDELGRT
jgi:hypothetical protein